MDIKLKVKSAVVLRHKIWHSTPLGGQISKENKQAKQAQIAGKRCNSRRCKRCKRCNNRKCKIYLIACKKKKTFRSSSKILEGYLKVLFVYL